MKVGKRYAAAAAQVDKQNVYAPAVAIKLAKATAGAKFDETIEVHFHLGVDPRQADQLVRGTVSLPHGTGKKVRVAVFAQGEKATEAKEAGADIVGVAELVAKVEKGELDFDVTISTPDMMATVGKLGKILGPRGLMPNPKAGTVTFDVGKAVKDVKAGRREYRVDKFGIIHSVIGKASFSEGQLAENYQTLLEEVLRAKPSAAKGKYLKSISVCASMGPGINVDPTKTRDILEA